MSVDERVFVCDRELSINYYVKSPVRYACHRAFSIVYSSPWVTPHRVLMVDVLDRPSGGVDFTGGRVLVEGAFWKLAEKGQYLYLRVSAPSGDGDGMDAVFARERNQVKVFLDTPWVGQSGFDQAWNLLFQTVFRASLEGSTEQLVNGLGLKVGKTGFLVKVLAQDPAEIVDVLTKSYPTLGENRMLLRKEKDDLRLYATPWTRDGHPYRVRDMRVEKLVLIKSDDTEQLTANQIRNFFVPASKDFALNSKERSVKSPIEHLSAVLVKVSSLEDLSADLERMASG